MSGHPWRRLLLLFGLELLQLTLVLLVLLLKVLDLTHLHLPSLLVLFKSHLDLLILVFPHSKVLHERLDLVLVLLAIGHLVERLALLDVLYLEVPDRLLEALFVVLGCPEL